MERLDSDSGKVISLIDRGLSASEITSALGDSPDQAAACIESLRRRGIIGHFSKSKKGVEKTPTPKLNYLWLEVTGKCNLNCIHCYARAEKKPVNPDLGYETIARTIREGARLGCLHLQFTGGEPTLRRDLKEMILEAKGLGIPKIEVFSNGFAMSEPLMDFFAREDVQLAISFYSHREKIHDSITGVKGSHRRTLNNLKKLAARDVSTRCEIILMEANKEDFWETAELLGKIGINLSNSHPLLPSGRGDGSINPTIYSTYSQIIGGPPFCANIWDFQRKKKWNGCWFGKAAVTFSGDVIPCVFARDQVVGNINHERLSRIIRGKMLSYWGLNKDKVDVCRECEYRYNCGDCPPLTYSLTGSLTLKPPYCRYDPYSGILKQ